MSEALREILITLQCPNCGDDVFVADTDGMFWEDDDGICDTCGLTCWIAVDGETAWVNHDDEYADKGQPRCTGACSVPRVADEFRGKPCAWNCKYTA